MTIDRYREIGGVQGAIAQRAEAVYANLTPEQQAAARRMLLRLTEPGEGTEDTRRRASVAELLPTAASPDVVEAVVQPARRRPVACHERDRYGREIVDVAHEALIRGWPRLQGWIRENPAGLRIHRRITETAAEWAAAGRDPSYLFSGQRLDEARRWAGDNDDDLNDAERDFLAASGAAKARAALTRRRRIQFAIGGTAVAMLLIAIAGLAAFVNWQEAQRPGDRTQPMPASRLPGACLRPKVSGKRPKIRCSACGWRSKGSIWRPRAARQPRLSGQTCSSSSRARAQRRLAEGSSGSPSVRMAVTQSSGPEKGGRSGGWPTES